MSSYFHVSICFIFALLSAPSFGADTNAETGVGQRVITKFRTELKVGGQVVSQGERERRPDHQRINITVYRVERVNGPWLWLVPEKGGARGWVRAGEVIPLSKAVDYFTGQIQGDPKNGTAYISRGLIWLETRGEPDKAIDDFNVAIRLDPRRATAYYDRGIAWDEKNEPGRAIADYTEAIRLDPRYARAYSNRGRAWIKKQDVDRAIADFTEAIRLEPTLSPVYRHRGVVWAVKGSYDRAIADLTEAIRLDPGDALAYDARAWIRSTSSDPGLRDVAKGLADAHRACELTAWRDASRIGTLAAAYALSGDTGRAAWWQEKANALFTDKMERERGEVLLQRYRDGMR